MVMVVIVVYGPLLAKYCFLWHLFIASILSTGITASFSHPH